MGRKRRSHKNLPAHVYFKHGAYYYVTPSKKWIKVGKTIAEMYQCLSELHVETPVASFGDVIDRYMIEISIQKAPSTHASEIRRSKYLKSVFMHMQPSEVTPLHIYKYLDLRGKSGKITANREISLLSHIFSYAIRWGCANSNPCSGIKKFSENRRNRNITNEEFYAFLSTTRYPIKQAAQLMYIMGLRPTEVLSLKKKNMKTDGFLVDLSKTKYSVGKKLIAWTPILKNVVNEVINITKRNVTHIDYLFCNSSGKPYKHDMFLQLWRRAILKAIDTGIIKEEFQFRDIRHKAATDMEKQNGREAARKFLGHTSQNTTARYIDDVSVMEGLQTKIIDNPE